MKKQISFLIAAALAGCAVTSDTGDAPVGSVSSALGSWTPPAVPAGATLWIEPPDFSSNIGGTPLRIGVRHVSGTAGVAFLKALAPYIDLVTWPDAVPVASTIRIDETPQEGVDAIATITPAAPLGTRWYAVRVSDAIEAESGVAVKAIDPVTKISRFTPASEVHAVAVHVCADGPVVEFSEGVFDGVTFGGGSGKPTYRHLQRRIPAAFVGSSDTVSPKTALFDQFGAAVTLPTISIAGLTKTNWGGCQSTRLN